MFDAITKSKGCDFRSEIIKWSRIIWKISTILCIPNNRSQTRATIEHIISNTCYAATNGDRSQTRAKTERPTSNTRHAVGSAVVGDGFGNNGRSQSPIIISWPAGLVRYLYGIRFATAGDIVVQVTKLEVIRPKSGSCHEGKKKWEKFFHCLCLFWASAPDSR